jgi:imidazolonepropionase-like amidohydrolase
MQAIKAELLYDGIGIKRNVYITFDEKILDVSEKKPECEIVGEGIVTPAFIDAHSHIGLDRAGEPSHEGEANDELSEFLPLNRAIDSIYTDDSSFKESVEHGVLYSHVMPGSGNIIGGRTCFIRNWESSVKRAFVKEIGMKAALGYNPRSTKEWKGERPTTRMGTIGLLRRELYKARKADNLIKQGKKSIEEIDPVTEAMIELLRGMPMMVHVHKSDDIYTLLSVASEFNLKCVANHCGDVFEESTWRELRDAGIPVIYGPIDSFSYKVELKHSSWRNVASLIAVNPLFGLMTDHPVVLQRDLFLQLRHFLRFGMSKERAIGIITQRNAEILGLQNLGTIEKGKLASMIVWSDDPFQLGSHPSMCIGESVKVYGE